MSRLTRDGTAEPVSRDQILRHARGQGNIIFSLQLTTSRIGNLTRLIHTLLYVMTIHTYIHTYVTVSCRSKRFPCRTGQSYLASAMAMGQPCSASGADQVRRFCAQSNSGCSTFAFGAKLPNDTELFRDVHTRSFSCGRPSNVALS